MTTMKVDLSRSWDKDGFGYKEALSQIASLPKVKDFEKLPLVDGFKEEYKWCITLPLLGDQRTRKQVENIVRYYSQDGKRYRGNICERFKTGSRYFVQVVLPGEKKNKTLIEELHDLWDSLGWQNITLRLTCGWVSIIASKRRFA